MMDRIKNTIWHELVRKRAYKISARSDRGMGDAQKNWYQAEEELRRELTDDMLLQIEKSHIEAFVEDFYSGISQALLIPYEASRIVLPQPSIDTIVSFNSLIKEIAHGRLEPHKLGWREFEDLLGKILGQFGWSIRPMGYTKDNGIDIIAVRKIEPGIPIEMMVQCKRYKPTRPVGVSVVREVWSVKWEHGFHQAMIATTSRFTKGAKTKTNEWNFDLRDCSAIIDWCKKILQGDTMKR